MSSSDEESGDNTPDTSRPSRKRERSEASTATTKLRSRKRRKLKEIADFLKSKLVTRSELKPLKDKDEELYKRESKYYKTVAKPRIKEIMKKSRELFTLKYDHELKAVNDGLAEEPTSDSDSDHTPNATSTIASSGRQGGSNVLKSGHQTSGRGTSVGGASARASSSHARFDDERYNEPSKGLYRRMEQGKGMDVNVSIYFDEQIRERNLRRKEQHGHSKQLTRRRKGPSLDNSALSDVLDRDEAEPDEIEANKDSKIVLKHGRREEIKKDLKTKIGKWDALIRDKILDKNEGLDHFVSMCDDLKKLSDKVKRLCLAKSIPLVKEILENHWQQQIPKLCLIGDLSFQECGLRKIFKAIIEQGDRKIWKKKAPENCTVDSIPVGDRDPDTADLVLNVIEDVAGMCPVIPVKTVNGWFNNRKTYVFEEMVIEMPLLNPLDNPGMWNKWKLKSCDLGTFSDAYVKVEVPPEHIDDSPWGIEEVKAEVEAKLADFAKNGKMKRTARKLHDVVENYSEALSHLVNNKMNFKQPCELRLPGPRYLDLKGFEVDLPGLGERESDDFIFATQPMVVFFEEESDWYDANVDPKHNVNNYINNIRDIIRQYHCGSIDGKKKYNASVKIQSHLRNIHHCYHPTSACRMNFENLETRPTNRDFCNPEFFMHYVGVCQSPYCQFRIVIVIPQEPFLGPGKTFWIAIISDTCPGFEVPFHTISDYHKALIENEKFNTMTKVKAAHEAQIEKSTKEGRFVAGDVVELRNKHIGKMMCSIDYHILSLVPSGSLVLPTVV